MPFPYTDGKRMFVNHPIKDLMEKISIMPEMIKSPADIKTAPFDPRFPNQNQTRYCYQSYLDFHRCQKVRGEKYEPCFYFQRVFKSLCPNEWVEKWDSQRSEGSFPGRI